MSSSIFSIRPRSPRPSSATRTTINTCIAGQSLAAPLPQVLINGGVLSLLILHLGGGQLEIGAVFSAEFLAQIVRVFTVRHVDVSDRKKMLIVWLTVGPLLFCGVFLAGFVVDALGPKAAAWYVIVLFFLHRAASNIGASAWPPLLCDLIPSALLGRFFGRMRSVFQTVSFFGVLLAAWYLGREPQLAQFFVVIGILLAMNLARILLFVRLPTVPPARFGRAESLGRSLMRPLQNAAFRRFLIFWSAVAFATNLGRPFAVPFLNIDLAFPSSFTIYASGGLVIGMVVTLATWGRLADRLGNRFVFLVSLVILACGFMGMSVIPTYAVQPVIAVTVAVSVFFAMGVALGGLGIAHTVRRMHEAPAEHRGVFMNSFFVVNGIVAGTGSMAAGALLDIMPTHLELFGRSWLTLRLFFPIVATLVLTTIILLRRLPVIAERSLRGVFQELVPRWVNG